MDITAALSCGPVPARTSLQYKPRPYFLSTALIPTSTLFSPISLLYLSVVCRPPLCSVLLCSIPPIALLLGLVCPELGLSSEFCSRWLRFQRRSLTISMRATAVVFVLVAQLSIAYPSPLEPDNFTGVKPFNCAGCENLAFLNHRRVCWSLCLSDWSVVLPVH